jgi:hypothetical protein
LATGIYEPGVPDATNADGWSGTAADAFYLANNSVASETEYVNAVAGTSFSTETKTDGGGVTSASFFSLAQYILIKFGADPNVVVIRNTSGVGQTYSWSGFEAEGGGLRHYTEFGEVPIPLPAAGWLLLAGVGGLAAMRRKAA